MLPLRLQLCFRFNDLRFGFRREDELINLCLFLRAVVAARKTFVVRLEVDRRVHIHNWLE